MMRLEEMFAIVTGTGEALGRPQAMDLAKRNARVAAIDKGGSNKKGVDAFGDRHGFRCANSNKFLAGLGAFAISTMLDSLEVGLVKIEQS